MTTKLETGTLMRPVTYANVLRHPGIGRIVVSMLLSRLGDGMWMVTVILFALHHFHSPLIAGIAAAAGQIPNKFLAPLVGTLLDRHGRTRLVLLDYIVAATCLASIATLSLANHLSEVVYLAICAVAGTTSILSATGLRSLFPMLLPRPMWDRGNALDSACYIIAGVAGPALAGVLVGIGSGETAVFVAASFSAAAAIAVVGIPDPPSTAPADESLWRAAWSGVTYVVRNPTLRGLGFVLTAINFGMGVVFVALPVLLITQLGGSSAEVGAFFMVYSVMGLGAGVFIGRAGSEGRERRLLFWGTVGTALGVAGLALAHDRILVIAALALMGLCNGPVDIGLFALRQRRTAPAMLGRAMAVTMALNGAGMPLGSMLAGVLTPTNTALTFAIAAVVTGLGAVAVILTIPRDA